MLKNSIIRKLMILFFLVGVSSLSVIGIYSYFNAKTAILNRTLDQLTSIKVIKNEQIRSFFQERFNNLLFFVNDNRIKAIFLDLYNYSYKQSLPKLLYHDFHLKKLNKTDFRLYGFNNMFFLIKGHKNEMKIFKTGDSTINEFNEDAVTLSLLKNMFDSTQNTNKPYIIDFTKRHATDTMPVCLIGMRLNCDESELSGILVLQIPISAVNNIMLEDNRENGLGNSGEIYLVGKDYLMRSNSRFIKNSVLNTKVQTTSVLNAFKDKIGRALIDDYRTISVLSSYSKADIKGLNWVIIAEIDYEEAMIPISSIRNDILFLSLLICILLFSLAHIISRTISQPVIRLKKAAQSIGEGKFDENVTVSSNDEIGMLTDTFNKMSAQLKVEKEQRMIALYDGQELERQRISRELHDGLGQKMVALKLAMESTNKQNEEKVRETIEEAKINFAKAIDELRQISNNLAPNILYESGLDIALKNLCTSLSRTTNLYIDFSTHGELEAKFYIYRIAQEALTNAIKHSEANKIEVQLIGNKDSLILIVEDNGKGFIPENKNSEAGNGMFNMKERAALLNGTFVVETEQGFGTTIRIKIPRKNSDK